MSNEEPYSREQVTCFVDLLKNELPEHRDNRGKRHPLAFVIAAFVLATLVAKVLNHSNTTSTLRITQEEVLKTYDDYEL
jgi:hypothetical protein